MTKLNTIWGKHGENEENFLQFRKTFNLSQIPSGPCLLRITCNGIYKLWVNGQMIARGPVHSGLDIKFYEEIDVRSALRAGQNCVAVWYGHFKYHTAHSPEGSPALGCELNLPGQVIASDASWRVREDASFGTPRSRRNGILFIEEIYDGGKDDNWQAQGYDDSSWSHALEVPMPWPQLELRPISMVEERQVVLREPFKTGEVLNQEFVPNMWGKISIQSISIYLLHDVVEPPRLTRVQKATDSKGNPVWRVEQPSYLDQSQPDQWCAVMIFDFGRELKGHPWFEVEGNDRAIIDMAVAEDITGNRVQAVRQSTRYGDRYILREGRQRHETFDWKGFRYLQLTFRKLTGPLLVHAVGVTELRYPVKKLGKLTSPEPLLSTIWETGAYSQEVCTNDRFMDCPWREQQQWLGDGRLQLLIFHNAFGDDPILRKFLADFSKSQHADGLVPSVSYSRSNSVRFLDYSLWWACGVRDVLTFHPDPAFAHEMFPALKKLLDHFEQALRPDGLLNEQPKDPVFIDWADVRKTGCSAGLNAVLALALRAGAEVAEFIGETAQEKRWNGLAEKIIAKFPSAFWHKERGLFADTEVTGKEEPHFSQHTQAMAVLLGVDPSLTTEALQKAMQDPSLVQAQPYFAYYLLEALAAADKGEEAISFILEKWGNMIKKDATTFWEEWQTTGTFRNGFWDARPRSYCHSWSAAPTAWLSRHHLGVRVDKPKGPLIFAPHPGGLAQAQGSVPTCYGTIAIDWKIKDGEFHASLKGVPKDCALKIRIPTGFSAKTFHLSTDGGSRQDV